MMIMKVEAFIYLYFFMMVLGFSHRHNLSSSKAKGFFAFVFLVKRQTIQREKEGIDLQMHPECECIYQDRVQSSLI